MGLGSDLVSTPMREHGATGDRYEFQAMWGLGLLFQWHDTKEDYAIVFEFHDDVALLNSSLEPSSIRFYQVKSKKTKGDWSLSDLLRRKKVKTENGVREKPSHIEKMFDSIDKFKKSVVSVDFISNKMCDFYTKQNAYSFRECGSEHFQKIVSSVKRAYPTATEAEISRLGFEQTHLSLGDVITHTKGKLQAFIAEHLGDDIIFNPETAYRAIIDDCRRKANFQGDVTSLQQAIRDKGITRANVEHWLDTIGKSSRAPDWRDIASRLVYPFAEERRIMQEYGIYRSAVLDLSNRAVQRIRMKITENLDSTVDDDELTLVDMVERIYELSEEVGRKYLTPFKPERLKAMIIYEIYAHSAG